MTIFMTILNGLLFVYSIFSLPKFLLIKDRKELYDTAHKVFVNVTTACTILILLNDAIALNEKWWTQKATQTLLALAIIYIVILIDAVIMQCCKSEFKMKWDSDGLLLLSIVILGLTGYITTI